MTVRFKVSGLFPRGRDKEVSDDKGFDLPTVSSLSLVGNSTNAHYMIIH